MGLIRHGCLRTYATPRLRSGGMVRTRARSRARVGSLTNLRSSYLGGACKERAVREDSAPGLASPGCSRHQEKMAESLDPTELLDDLGQKLPPDGARISQLIGPL